MQLPLDAITSSATETEELGAAFAELLLPGDVVWLEGDLGAGKTVLARGCLRALGVEAVVTSPTFTIARRYGGSNVSVSHLDLYRLGDNLAGEDPGVFDPEFGDDRITLVEWPRRGEGVLPAANYRVELAHESLDTRRLRISKCQ